MFKKKKVESKLSSPPVEYISYDEEEKERKIISERDEEDYFKKMEIEENKEEKVENKIEKEETKENKEEEKERWQVVKELPLQQVRETETKEGKKLNFITIEEALTLLLNQDLE